MVTPDAQLGRRVTMKEQRGEQVTFGGQLQQARKRAGYRTQQALGEAVGVSGRTIRNWETDYHRPDARALTALRGVLGRFDIDGDDVERAVMLSGLTEDRKYAVLGFYKRQQREQAMEEGVDGG